jgi:peptidoglycan/LPS O-acetylase OafA/YrhL
MADAELHGVSRGRYLPEIDALRGAAVIGVFLFHLYQSVWPKAKLEPLLMWGDLRAHPDVVRWIGVPSLFGYAGVPLFFVISGFCIHVSFLQSRRPFAYRPFMGRRFWRIYPAYVVAIGLSMLLPGNLIWKTRHVRKSVLLHLLFLHNINQTTIYELSPPFWTLAVEFQFYAAYPVFLLLRRRLGPTRTLLASFALCGVCSGVGHLIPPGHACPIWLNPFMYWVQWCLGAVVAERFVEGRPRLLGMRVAAIPWIIGVLFAVPISVYSEWNYFAWAILGAAVIERVVRVPRPVSVWTPVAIRPIIWIGAISYSVYLLHVMILWQLLPRLTAAPGSRFVLGIVAVFPLVIVASAVSYFLVEMPGIAVGRRVVAWCFPGFKASGPSAAFGSSTGRPEMSAETGPKNRPCPPTG